MTIEELIRKSLDHAREAEDVLKAGRAMSTTEAYDRCIRDAAVEATLAEAYARMASAQIVNATSLNTALASMSERPRSDA